jgi:hypothetical protein
MGDRLQMVTSFNCCLFCFQQAVDAIRTNLAKKRVALNLPFVAQFAFACTYWARRSSMRSCKIYSISIAVCLHLPLWKKPYRDAQGVCILHTPYSG